MGTSNSSQRFLWLFLIFNLNCIVAIFGATINSGEGLEVNTLNLEFNIKPLLEETTPVTQSDDTNNDDVRAAEATTLTSAVWSASDSETNVVNLKSDNSPAPEADPRLSMPCLTNDGQDGICTTFQDCFPILFGFEKLVKQPYTTQLQKDVLATTTRCLPKEGKVKVKTGRAEDLDSQSKNEVVCCTSYIRLSRPPSDDYENENGSDERDSEAVVIGSDEDIAVISAVPASAEFEPIFNGTGDNKIEDLDSIGWGGNLHGHRPPVRNLTGEEPLIQSSCVSTKVVNLVVPPQEAIAPKGAYPWMAALMNNRGTQFCGGSLIDNYHILTAAHCIAHFKKPADVAKMRVYLGAHNLHATESTRMTFKVARILKHAKYSDRTFVNDIALLKLAQPVKLTPSVAEPLCLNRKPGYDDGKMNATLAGWGRTSVVGGPSSILRHGTMRMWTNTECQTRYSQYIGPEQIPKIQPTMICAGSPGVDACQGDSGGPLFMKQENGPNEQYGIVSWGIGCGLYPGVYTRVDEYIQWIDKNRGLTKATAAGR